MVITRFNRFVSKHGRAAFIVIGLIIVIPFVFFFGPGQSGRGRGPEYSGPVVEVYGDKVNIEEFRREMRAADVMAELRHGRGFSSSNRMRGYWMQETINRLVGVEAARRRGLDDVADEHVAMFVRDLPRFQMDNGEFDRDAFKSFSEKVLEPRGITGAEFDGMVRDTIMLERLESLATLGVMVSENEVRQAVKREEQSVRLRFLEMDVDEALKEVDLGPTDEEAEAFFAEHRETIELPDTRRVAIADVSIGTVKIEEDISQEDVDAYYENHKRFFKDTPREQADKQIRTRLATTRKRSKANSNAQDLRRAMLAANEDTGDKSLKEVFETVVAEHEAWVGESSVTDWFSQNEPSPKLERRPRLLRAACTLTHENPISPVIYERGRYSVLCLLEVKERDTPEELTPEVREIIDERLVRERIERFYAEHIEPYREQVEQGLDPDDIVRARGIELRNQRGVSDEEARAEIRDLREEVDTYLRPYYRPARRRVLVVPFPNKWFEAGIDIPEEDARQYYQEHEDEYAREEVKARHILIEVPKNAEQETVDAARKKLMEIREKIIAGADFADMAREHSEGPSGRRGGDLGWFGKAQMAKPFSEKAFSMDPGEVSDHVRTQFGLHIIKVEDKRGPRSFEEVAEEIRGKLRTRQGKRRASVAAYEFADEAYNVVRERAEDVEPAIAFRALAKKRDRDVKESGWFTESGRMPAFPRETRLARSAYKVTRENPVSEAIEGQTGAYVACWVGTTPGSLPKLGEDAGLERRVRRQLQEQEAMALLHTRAEELRRQLVADMADGMAFEEALPKDVSFESVEPFKLAARQPPQGLPAPYEVMPPLQEAAAGDFLPPIETEDGLLLVYFEERILPNEEEVAERLAGNRARLRARKERALAASAYDDFRREADFRYLGPWAEDQ